MAEMHGGCDHFAMDLKAETAAWQGVVHELKAGFNPDSAGMLEIFHRSSVMLEQQNKVKLAVKPENNWGTNRHAYAGLLRFEIPKAGFYRFATDRKLWLEVINARTKKRIPETTYEMQSLCKNIFKVLVYDLVPGDTYWLQISDSNYRNINVLIYPERAAAEALPTAPATETAPAVTPPQHQAPAVHPQSVSKTLPNASQSRLA